jgi:hypothetical protein
VPLAGRAERWCDRPDALALVVEPAFAFKAQSPAVEAVLDSAAIAGR